MGHELRRPEADLLRDGVHELRIRHLRSNYRVLYFFHEQAAVIALGLKKESEVSDTHIDRAISYLERFKVEPRAHTFVE